MQAYRLLLQIGYSCERTMTCTSICDRTFLLPLQTSRRTYFPTCSQVPYLLPLPRDVPHSCLIAPFTTPTLRNRSSKIPSRRRTIPGRRRANTKLPDAAPACDSTQRQLAIMSPYGARIASWHFILFFHLPTPISHFLMFFQPQTAPKPGPPGFC